jgi:hypothetical protein
MSPTSLSAQANASFSVRTKRADRDPPPAAPAKISAEPSRRVLRPTPGSAFFHPLI